MSENGFMPECEIHKSSEWAGQYECATHGVWYRDSDTNPSELCPVGEAYREAVAELVLRIEAWCRSWSFEIRTADTKSTPE